MKFRVLGVGLQIVQRCNIICCYTITYILCKLSYSSVHMLHHTLLQQRVPTRALADTQAQSQSRITQEEEVDTLPMSWEEGIFATCVFNSLYFTPQDTPPAYCPEWACMRFVCAWLAALAVAALFLLEIDLVASCVCVCERVKESV
jgi:hypothetical protein